MSVNAQIPSFKAAVAHEQKAFISDFYELQKLGLELADTPDHLFTQEEIEDINGKMHEKIDEANKILPIVGGMVIEGARNCQYCFAGDSNTGPEKKIYRPFRKYPFMGTLVGLEAVQAPQPETPGLVATLALDSVGYFLPQHPELRSTRLFDDHDIDERDDRRWIPIGGVNLSFSWTNRDLIRASESLASLFGPPAAT